MDETIKAPQTARQIDKDLRAIYEAQDPENNGLILYIRQGKLAFAEEEVLFTVTPLTGG